MAIFSIPKLRNQFNTALTLPKSAYQSAQAQASVAQKRVQKVAGAIHGEFQAADTRTSKGIFYAKLLIIPIFGGMSASASGIMNSVCLFKGLEGLRHTYDMTCVVKKKLEQSAENMDVYVRGYIQDNPDLNPVVRTGLKCAVAASSVSTRALGFALNLGVSVIKGVATRILPTDAIASGFKDKRVLAAAAVAAVLIAPTAYFGLGMVTLAVRGVGFFSMATIGLKHAESIQNSKPVQNTITYFNDKVLGRELTSREKEVAIACAVIGTAALIGFTGSKIVNVINESTNGTSSYLLTAVNIGAYSYYKFSCLEKIFCEDDLTDARKVTDMYEDIRKDQSELLDEVDDIDAAIELYNVIRGQKADFKDQLHILMDGSSLEHMSANITFKSFCLLEERASLKAGDLIRRDLDGIKGLRFEPLPETRAGLELAEKRIQDVDDQKDRLLRLSTQVKGLKKQAKDDVTEGIGILHAMLHVHELDKNILELKLKLEDEVEIRQIKRNKQALKYVLSSLKSINRMIKKHKTKMDKVKSNFRYMDERALPTVLVEGAAEFIGQRDHEDAEQMQAYFASRVATLISKLDRAELALDPELVPVMVMVAAMTGIPIPLITALLTKGTKAAELKAEVKDRRLALRQGRKAKQQATRRSTREQTKAPRYNLRSGRGAIRR